MRFLIPRSVLFVPASRTDLFDKAAAGDADALCFDLEDGVDASLKEAARDNLAAACALADEAGKIPMVRINSEAELIDLDLSVLPPVCQAVLLPKVRDLAHMSEIATQLEVKAAGGGVDAYLIPLIEDAGALLALESNFSPVHPRVLALCVGTEDFSNALGCEPDSRLMQSVVERTAIVASAMGISLLGFPGSIANFNNLDVLRRAALAGLDCGSLGALCIHPAQVSVLNDAFTPSAASLSDATRIVLAFEGAADKGQGAIAVDGKMIDLPVYKRARSLIARGNLILK